MSSIPNKKWNKYNNKDNEQKHTTISSIYYHTCFFAALRSSSLRAIHSPAEVGSCFKAGHFLQESSWSRLRKGKGERKRREEKGEKKKRRKEIEEMEKEKEKRTERKGKIE